VAAKPKNVIILTSDEMRGDCPGFMGNPDCRTPNIDRFARRAVAFRNHFAVHGKCVPSRVSMVTGRYSHTDGFRTIQQHLPPDQPNLLGKLKECGYESAVFGLNHVWQTLFASNEKSQGYADYHSFVGHYHGMAKKPYPVAVPGPGSRTPPHYDVGFAYGRRVEGEITGFSDDARTDQAIDYLTKTRDRSRPFYLHVNLSKPHPAYEVEEPYYSMYDPWQIAAWPHDLPSDPPLHMRMMREVRTSLDPPPPEGALRELQAVYYAMVTKVDVLLGRILDTVEAEGLFEDSIVIFTVDHGDFAGQYGLVEKWDTCMADCLLHVPLVLWAPRLPAGTWVEGLTEHVDLPKTVLELLGIEPDWGIHGGSLLPAVRDGRCKQAVFADGGHEEEMWGRFSFGRSGDAGAQRKLDGKQRTYRDCPETMARTKMVRTDRWKLILRLLGGNEMYDMQNDPYELTNLWPCSATDPKLGQVVRDLQQKMIEWCLRTDTDRPYQEDVGA
jgi:arylsulfatase A-like enzyme